jgi:drug/metabolite transporter (DMT)-like permease
MDLDVSLNYAFTLLAALLIGTGFVFQQNAAAREPASRFLSLRLMLDLIRTRKWLVGIVCMVAGQVLAAWSIGHLSLSFVEPLLTMNLVFALLLAVPLSGASIKFWEIVGALVLCTGVALLSAARSAQPIGLSFGSFSHWPAAAVIAGVAYIAVHAGRLRKYRARAMLTGAGAGLVYGIQDALTRQTLQILQSNGTHALFTTWAPYALVGAGAIGIWLMQSAFSAAPLQFSLPPIAAGEPIIGILLGVIIFGDRVQITPGMLALQAAGIAAMIVGVILVARAPALSALRTWSPSNIPHPHPHLHVIQLSPGGATPRQRLPGGPPPDPRTPGMPDGKANISGMHPHANGTRPPDGAADKDRKAAPEAGTTQDPRRDVRGLRRPPGRQPH